MTPFFSLCELKYSEPEHRTMKNMTIVLITHIFSTSECELELSVFMQEPCKRRNSTHDLNILLYTQVRKPRTVPLFSRVCFQCTYIIVEKFTF